MLAVWAGITWLSSDDGSPIYAVAGPDSVAWTADGSWIIAEYLDGEDVPRVVAIDAETGTPREQVGYVIASVEPTGAVVWLEPMGAERWRTIKESGLPWPGELPVDTPPTGLLAWDLDADAPPSDSAPSRWEPTSGGGEWDVYYEVDVLRGRFPSKLLFMNNTHRDEGHKAQLPDGFGTFRPVGFSPSGSYVAIEELTWIESIDDGGELAYDAVNPPARRVLVIEPATGEIVDEALIDAPARTTVEWLGYRDALVWFEVEPPTDAVDCKLCGLVFEPGSDPAPLAQALGWPGDSQALSADGLFRPDSTGVTGVVWSGLVDEIWRIEADGPILRGKTDRANDIDVHPRAGIVTLREEARDGGFGPVVALLDTPDGEEREVWSGPTRTHPSPRD